jgi:hypothetical protein
MEEQLLTLQIFKEQDVYCNRIKESGNYTVVLKQQTKNPSRFLLLGSCVWSLFRTFLLSVPSFIYTKPERP